MNIFHLPTLFSKIKFLKYRRNKNFGMHKITQFLNNISKLQNIQNKFSSILKAYESLKKMVL